MICPNCGRKIGDNSMFCYYCGGKVYGGGVCRSCGEQYGAGEKYCHSCGAPLFEEMPPIPEKPKKKNKFTIPLIILGVILVAAIICHAFGVFDKDTDELTPADDGDTPAAEETLPADSCRQKLELESSGSLGTLSLYNLEDGEWVLQTSVPASIGKNGISYNKTEGDRCTPAGTFDILYYIGLYQADSGLDFKQVRRGDTWVCDPNSASYNLWKNKNIDTVDWNTSKEEDLYNKFAKGYSEACIVFDYNGDGLDASTVSRKGGSDIFIDGVGSSGKLNTGYGDIKISSADMYRLLSLLDKSKNPMLIVK